MTHYDNYFKDLNEYSPSEATEHSHRGELKTLLKEIAAFEKIKVTIIHEPKRDRIHGAPDYLIKKDESIVGYIENKKIEDSLRQVLGSDQIKKYKELSNNILLTNYHEFVWIHNGTISARENLFEPEELGNKKFKLDPQRVEKVNAIIKGFLSQNAEGIGKPQKLAEALAIRAKYLKDILLEELTNQKKNNTEGRLLQLYDTFKQHVFHELTITEFADAFAQNLAYGLFLAKLNAGEKPVGLYGAKQYIPHSFELIAELVNFLDELEREEYQETKWIVEEILSILNNLNLQEIRKGLFYHSVRSHTLFGEDEFSWRDPFIYFYELFLKKYDKKLRQRSGAFYTPPPVVNFIVGTIDKILQEEFGIPDGLADRRKVTVLDFATGTGTFILEVFQQIIDKLPAGSGKKDAVIKEHLLKNIYGFEYLIAPYTIAHLKLSQYLKEKGYELQDRERLQVFLTNTLEKGEKNARMQFLPALSSETTLSQEVKDKPILVITGNPPYYYKSKNPSYRYVSETKKGKNGKERKIKKKVFTDIGKLVNDYYFVDGIKIKEKNPKGLQDDYVKFIRFAQSKMENVDEGIVGIITNHAFLSNPTFPGMRKSLLDVFDHLHFIDLHGNKEQNETTPDGGIDDNVFDIRKGVAISILVKKPGLRKQVYHYDVWGRRKEKYEYLFNRTLLNMTGADKTKIKPASPFYFFMEQDEDLKERYNSFFSIKDTFKLGQEGIKTHRDHFVIDISLDPLKKRINELIDDSLSDKQIKDKYKLEESTTWKLAKVRNELRKLEKKDIDGSYQRIQYRPFDYRWIFYSDNLIDRSRRQTAEHLLASDHNISLLSVRQFAYHVPDFCYSFVSTALSDNRTFVSNKGTCLFYPLYLSIENSLLPNFTEKFKSHLKEKGVKAAPEEIFSYIYAILYSPTYRKKYFNLLKSDYPKIPFTDDKRIFSKLSKLGKELEEAHLFKIKINSELGVFLGKGENKVEEVKFVVSGKYGKLYINENKYYDKVPVEVYEFYIGGYKVLENYLKHKDRRGRILELDEVETVENIIKVLAFTIEQMKMIDALTKDWI